MDVITLLYNLLVVHNLFTNYKSKPFFYKGKGNATHLR